ncbi:MAG: DUF1622 domain-containing protein [Cyanobacteria bacterium J06641_5]
MKYFVANAEHILLASSPGLDVSPMERFVDNAHHILSDLISVLTLCLEAIAAALILLGVLRTFQLVLRLQRRRNRRYSVFQLPVDFTQVRMVFGMWLALALEVQLGADILNTTISPSFEALGKLAAISVIRTFLNYFLQKEIEMATKELQHAPNEEVDSSIQPAPEA